MPKTVVVIGDSFEESEFALFARRFEKVLALQDPAGAAGLIASERPQLAILGSDIPSDAALGLLVATASATACPIAVLTRGLDERQARDLRNAGALDCLQGPLTEDSMEQLLSLLKTCGAREQAADRYFCRHCPPGVPFVGRSIGTAKTLEMIKTVSSSLCNPVLLLGETGTGKELAARAVHSWRCADPDKFIAVNCATLNVNLLESELFGHVKGSFTGADRDKPGLLEVADSGTILLDEISEMPLELQAKLLRFLQERKFRKVGGTSDIRSHATVVASSNLSLFEHARAGRFRKDLYYRLAVFPIELPPLRAPERRDDILLLAEYFINASASSGRSNVRGISDEACRRLLSHTWPGNVRELQNVIARAMILEKSDRITSGSIVVEGLSPETPVVEGAAQAGEFSLETAEREFIHRALQVAGGHRTRAADLLGITRATLHAKIKRYDIQVPSSQPEGELSAGRLRDAVSSEKLARLG